MTFKFKLLITFIVYGLSLVVFSQAVMYKLNEEHIKKASIEKAAEIFEKKNELFEFYIQDTNLKLLALKNSTIFKEYLSSSNNTTALESLFLDIASTADNIMQLRYINKEGMEVVRIDRNSYSDKAYIVPKDNLQEKSKRYYFEESMQSNIDEFWYSHLDLNIEHSEIEQPVKPVLRVATPVVYKQEKVGIVIINIFMKHFLEKLVDDAFNNIYFFNENGHIMVDSLHQHCWSQYLTNNEMIYNHFDNNNFEEILSKEEYIGKEIYAHKISLNNGENIQMVVEPKYEYIEDELVSIVYELVFILLGVVLVSLPLSYFFSNIPTKLKEEVDKQKEDQDILLSLFDLGDAVLFKWNNDDVWSVNFVSKSVEKLLNYTQNDFINANISYSDCIHTDDLERVEDEVTQAIEDNLYFFEHKPYRIITKDKELKWILDRTVIVRDKSGDIVNFIGYLNDITELKNTEILLQKLSRTDQLTQIYNRMYLDDLLQRQYYRFNRSGEECSIVLVDIDYFKLVNDEHGHLVGDKVLVSFANLLKNSLRDGDNIGRWGGEEFLIILPHTSLSQATVLAEKLRKIVQNKDFPVIDHKTASFGVSSFADGITIELLINQADMALYQSKNSGRNRVTSLEFNSCDE